MSEVVWSLSATGELLRNGRQPSIKELADAVETLNRKRKHGGRARYGAGCRCGKCRAWASAKKVRRRKQINATLPAPKKGQEWTGPELEMCLRPDLTARQVATMLGRSFYATRNMRHLARTDPKYIQLVGASRTPQEAE